MLIRNIRILDEITDIENDSIDVCVDSEDGYTFIVSITTTKHLLQRMNEEKSQERLKEKDEEIKYLNELNAEQQKNNEKEVAALQSIITHHTKEIQQEKRSSE